MANKKNTILDRYSDKLLGRIQYKILGRNDIYAEDLCDEKYASDRFYEVGYFETTLTDDGIRFALEYYGEKRIVELMLEAMKKYNQNDLQRAKDTVEEFFTAKITEGRLK